MQGSRVRFSEGPLFKLSLLGAHHFDRICFDNNVLQIFRLCFVDNTVQKGNATGNYYSSNWQGPHSATNGRTRYHKDMRGGHPKLLSCSICYSFPRRNLFLLCLIFPDVFLSKHPFRPVTRTSSVTPVAKDDSLHSAGSTCAHRRNVG